jgi:8-oxo-dGTP pyrophosphatase MutT (NUDIX family)
LVDPTYKDGWDLPGGMVEANESPRAGALRELDEELGLAPVLGRPLGIEWVAAHGPWDDQVVFVFDGGTLTTERAATVRVRDPELAAWEFFDVEDARAHMRDDIWRRLRAARDSLELGTTSYLERIA